MVQCRLGVKLTSTLALLRSYTLSNALLASSCSVIAPAIDLSLQPTHFGEPA